MFISLCQVSDFTPLSNLARQTKLHLAQNLFTQMLRPEQDL